MKCVQRILKGFLILEENVIKVFVQIKKSYFSTFSLKLLTFKYINVEQKWGVCDKTGFI